MAEELSKVGFVPGVPAGGGGVTDHGALTGLADDDHLQYLNLPRHDVIVGNPHSVSFSQAVAADAGTDILASEAETLSDGSNADALHSHAAIPGADHGALLGLVDDDHLQYLLLVGRSGGQTAFGSPTNGESLTLAGNPGANPGFVNLNSPVVFGPYTGNPAAAYGFDYSVTDNPIGAFVGGGLNFSGNITTGNSTFIYESFRGAPTITTGVNLGFAAYTVLQALPNLKAGAGAGHNPLPALILNAGATVETNFSGTRTVSSVAGMNFGCALKATVSGATLNCTTWTGLTVAPFWNTVSGSIINFGNVIGVDVRNPTQQLFGSSGGIERMNSYHALKVQNPTISNGFGTMPCSAVRSEITPGVNRYFLLNQGNAQSDHGAGHIFFDDNFGIAYGGNGVANFDAWVSWNSAGFLRTFFISSGDSIQQTSPAADRFMWAGNGGNGVVEFTFNCHKFSLGAQSGNNGNQIGAFVAGTRSTQLAGEWADFLLTNAGNITVDHAMAAVYGWGVNAPSILLGTGTVTTAGVLNVGGNVAQGSVNRFGVRILSNPSGGSGINAALWVTAGLSQFDGRVDINNPIALGGGAAATLGTIGGTGPTAAAQAQWVEIDVGGVAHWVPAWV